MAPEYFQSKHRNQANQNERNRDAYKKINKEYKKQLKRACHEHYRIVNTQLKRLRTGNARQYWAILNRLSNKRNAATLPTDDELFEYFRNLNEAPDIPSKDEEEILYEALRMDTEELDKDITETEVKTCIQKLKTNNAWGTDGILNEYLKTTVDIMYPIYTKIFNIILSNGVIPTEWTLGQLTPIFKKKGDRKKPQITEELLS